MEFTLSNVAHGSNYFKDLVIDLSTLQTGRDKTMKGSSQTDSKCMQVSAVKWHSSSDLDLMSFHGKTVKAYK